MHPVVALLPSDIFLEDPWPAARTADDSEFGELWARGAVLTKRRLSSVIIRTLGMEKSKQEATIHRSM